MSKANLALLNIFSLRSMRLQQVSRPPASTPIDTLMTVAAEISALLGGIVVPGRNTQRST
jgi:hypothetical protein